MPLFDHFRKPFSTHHPWQSIHSTWVNSLVQQLNGDLLPKEYYSLPTVQLGRDFEIDVATIERARDETEAGGTVATAVWAPPHPPITLPVEFTTQDQFEVRVMKEDEGTLVAAIELVSPANKDRLANREAFVIKCAAYLQQGISVIVIDVVTQRKLNLHAELLKLLRLPTDAPGTSETLYAAAYRTIGPRDGLRLEAWPEPLAIGQELPTLPLWLDVDLALPLDLEQSYLSACRSLRIDEKLLSKKQTK